MMVQRYVSRDLIEKFFHRDDWDTPDERWRPESEFGAFIDALPDADVAEIKHGEWEQQEENELKPCPFCGGRATISKERLSSGMDGSYYDWRVRCTLCGAQIWRSADTFYGRKSYTKDEVVEAWNRGAKDE